MSVFIKNILFNMLDLKIEHEINEHTKAYIVGIIDEKEKDAYVKDINYGDEIGITYALEDNKTKRLFCGSIVSIQVVSKRNVYYMCIEAQSATCSMDIKYN